MNAQSLRDTLIFSSEPSVPKSSLCRTPKLVNSYFKVSAFGFFEVRTFHTDLIESAKIAWAEIEELRQIHDRDLRTSSGRARISVWERPSFNGPWRSVHVVGESQGDLQYSDLS